MRDPAEPTNPAYRSTRSAASGPAQRLRRFGPACVVVALVFSLLAATPDPAGAGSDHYSLPLPDVTAGNGITVAATLEASFRATEAETGQAVMMDFSISNTALDAKTGLGFTFELPAGLVVGSGATGNTCNGTLTATIGTTVVSLAGGDVGADASCVVSVPVVASTAGDYAFTGDSVTSITGFDNAVGTATLTVTMSSDLCPTGHGWDVVADQVGRLYGATIGRAADSDGLTYWTRSRLQGLAAPDLASILLASDEWIQAHGQLGDEAFVDALYQQVLARTADGDGKMYWVGLLDDGLGRPALVLLFSDSTENVARTGTRTPMTDSESLICRLYQTLLQRSPDAGGFAHWSSVVDAGSPARAIAALILAMTEAAPLAQLSDEDFVDRLYQDALGRHADPDGKSYWAGLIAAHGREAVAAWLANSYEA